MQPKKRLTGKKPMTGYKSRNKPTNRQTNTAEEKARLATAEKAKEK